MSEITIKELAIRDLDRTRMVPRRISEKLLGLYEMLKGIDGKGVYITHSTLPSLAKYLDREILTEIQTKAEFFIVDGNVQSKANEYWKIFDLFLQNKRMSDSELKYFSVLVKEVVKRYADMWMEQDFRPFARKMWRCYDEMGLLHKKNG